MIDFDALCRSLLVDLPCSCYVFDATHPENYEGCTCGNYDDANRQGYAQGWNAALRAVSEAAKRNPT